MESSELQPEQPDFDRDLRRFIRVVLKHYGLMGSIVTLCMASALIYCLTAPKIWESTVSIRLPSKGDSSVMDKLSTLVGDSDPVETYIEIARSGNVAMRAAMAVDLTGTAEYAGRSMASVVASLRKNIQVTTVKDSTIIELSVRAKNQDLAVSLGNALAQAFIDANLDFSRTSARSRRLFIQDQVGQVKEQLNQSELDLEKFAASDKSLVATLGGGSQGGDAAVNPLVKLKSDIIDMEVARAELADRFSPDHPRIQEMNAQINAAQKTYDREMAKLPADSMDFNKRDRDVKVGEEIYALLLEKLEEARISENTNDSDIVVIDSADMPVVPVAPQKRRIMLVTLLLSLLGAYGVASLLDFFRDEIKGEDELSRRTHLPILAVIPDWREYKNSNSVSAGPPLKVRHDPSTLIFQPQFQHTYYAEASKILRTNLAFAGLGHERKFVSLMSACRDEGKTTCNANLAIALAQIGNKVLLCDADLRKPTVHKLFGLTVKPDQGLPLLISGQRQLEDMVVQGPVENLWLLPCGVLIPNPSELLGSSRMVNALTPLREQYDYLVFDVAPVLPVTDSVLLAPLMDGVGLVARYEKTRIREVDLAVRQLRSAKANIFGLVLNAVNMQRYSYGYGYGNKYYSYYGKEPGETIEPIKTK